MKATARQKAEPSARPRRRNPTQSDKLTEGKVKERESPLWDLLLDDEPPVVLAVEAALEVERVEAPPERVGCDPERPHDLEGKDEDHAGVEVLSEDELGVEGEVRAVDQGEDVPKAVNLRHVACDGREGWVRSASGGGGVAGGARVLTGELAGEECEHTEHES